MWHMASTDTLVMYSEMCFVEFRIFWTLLKGLRRNTSLWPHWWCSGYLSYAL